MRKKLSNVLSIIEDWIMMGTFIVLVLLNFFNVITRFVIPSLSVAYNEELSVYLFVWLCMFGASVCFRENEHLSLPLFYDMFPAKVKAAVSVLGNLVTIATVVVMSYYTTLMVINQIDMHIMAQSMNVSTAIAGIAMPLGGIFTIIRCLENMVSAVSAISNKDKTEGEEDITNA